MWIYARIYIAKLVFREVFVLFYAISRVSLVQRVQHQKVGPSIIFSALLSMARSPRESRDNDVILHARCFLTFGTDIDRLSFVVGSLHHDTFLSGIRFLLFCFRFIVVECETNEIQRYSELFFKTAASSPN